MGPYGKLSELPVAVVNKDQAASYNGESMNIGEDMVSNLKDNDALNFHFCNRRRRDRRTRKWYLLYGRDIT